MCAVEASAAMIAQRPPGVAPAVQASAEAIPLPDGCADAVLAVLTVHHWHDPARGLAELCRIARRRVVVFTWDRHGSDGFLAAYWRRPAACLDPRIRASMSNFALPGAPPCETGLARLAADVASGEWTRRYADVLALEELDVGYRLVIADL